MTWIVNCSIGISYTKFLAKFASDIAEKKSILVIRDRSIVSEPFFLSGPTAQNLREVTLEEAMKDRPLTDAWGINTRMEARLNALGITNLLELKNYDRFELKRLFGSYGYYLWANVNGIEITEVQDGQPPPKSVGHSYCLPKKTRDKKYLGAILYKLCEKTGRRLRALKMEARSMHIAFAYTYEGGISRSFKTPDKMFTTEEIHRWAGEFLECANLILPVRMIAVSVSRLAPVSSQMALFHDNLKLNDLSRSVDELNDKYGEYTVIRGEMFGTENAARDRIGFRKIELT